MLHIVNGDSATETLKQSGIKGEYLAFREALQEGPAPEGLSADEWVSTRARFLAGDSQVDIEACLKGLRQQQNAIKRFGDHDEVVLWFSHDLCCQITLIYLLSWFAEQDRGETELSLICISEFPGVAPFACLGQLTAPQLASLFEQRHPVTLQKSELATRAWRAYCSASPEDLLDLLNEDTTPLPYLRDALLRHLARFPSKRNGLGYVQNRALQLISDGYSEFKTLFPRFGRSDPAYGLGDSQFWDDVLRMSQASKPLVIIKGLEDLEHSLTSNAFHDAAFELTAKGKAALAATSDFVRDNGIDHWFGGAHLTDTNLWRWDEETQSLIRG